MEEAVQDCSAGAQCIVRPEETVENENPVTGKRITYSKITFHGSDGAKLTRQPVASKHNALMIFDFDGVLTDNRVWVTERGAEMVCCNRADGLGFDMLRAAGIPCLILSTERNPVVAHRAKKLRIPVAQAVSDKAQEVRNQCRARGIDPRKVAYVGNDVNDLAAMQLVGMPWCPADAALEVRRICVLTLKARGGEGVVREIARRLGLKWQSQK